MNKRLVTGANQSYVLIFFNEHFSLSIKDLGCARKIQALNIQCEEEAGYSFDQEVEF